MPSRNLLAAQALSGDYHDTADGERLDPIPWYYTEHSSTTAQLHPGSRYGYTYHAETMSIPPKPFATDSIECLGTSQPCSRRPWHRRITWPSVRSRKSTVGQDTPQPNVCTVRHQYYCPRKLESKHLFFDYKVASRIMHIRDDMHLSKGVGISGGALDAVGDLAALRREKQIRRERCLGGLEVMKEPAVPLEVASDIFSVIEFEVAGSWSYDVASTICLPKRS